MLNSGATNRPNYQYAGLLPSRAALGADLVFVVLNLTRNCQQKRIEARHTRARGGETSKQVAAVLTKMYGLYEPAGEDEERAYNVSVTEEMTTSDVLQEVLGILATA